jgi:hypothetical protein
MEYTEQMEKSGPAAVYPVVREFPMYEKRRNK